MNKKHKEMLMASVTSDTLKRVQNKLKQHNQIIKDKDFFDYELLKAALNRGHQAITSFLLKLGCRVRNTNKVNSDETPLHLAMKLGNYNIITKILLSGASIYDKNENGETPIQAGFKQGHQDSVRTTLRLLYSIDKTHRITLPAGAFNNPDPKDKDDILHFHIACIMNHLDVVKQYLEFGFDINSPLSLDSAELSGLNPLHYAATKKYYNSYWQEFSLFGYFLKQGADLSIKNRDGLTALHIFYYSNDHSLIGNIFDHKNETKFINSIDNHGVSHFHLCCLTMNPENVQVFIDKGVDVNSAVSLNCTKHPGFTPLHFAVKYGSDEVVQLLLQNGADCSKMDKDSNTPLHLANNWQVKLIFNHGNDTKFINSVNSDGLSHFHLCCTQNYPDLVKVFIDKGVDVNSYTVSFSSLPELGLAPLHFEPGFTPLHFAIMYCCDKVVQLLLKHGADCNKTANNGTTPLHLACHPFDRDVKVKLSIIEMLLNYEASVVIVDEIGRTPLHLAFDRVDHNIAKTFDMLISKIPRKVNFTDSDGLSHFHIVCTNNDISRVEDFLKSGVPVDSSVASGYFAGYTALHFAAIFNQMHIVEMLLNWKAQVDIKTHLMGVTPLYFACEFSFTKVSKMYNHYEFAKLNNESITVDWTLNRADQLNIIKLLLQHGADVENKDRENATVLLNTCQVAEDFSRNHSEGFCSFIEDSLEDEIISRIKEIIEILLLNKANINARLLLKQESILHIIAGNYFLNNSEGFIAFILSKGADINTTDSLGYTPLHYAVTLKNKKLIDILLKHKANVNAKTNCSLSFTPLQIACKNICMHSSKNQDILCTLLEASGSNLNVRDNKGILLLQDAIENHETFIIEKLLYYGADINMEDSQGNLSVFSLFSWISELTEFYWTNDKLCIEIFKIIFLHVQKLLAAGHYIHEEIQQCCIKLNHRYSVVCKKSDGFRNLDNIYDNCLEELDKMKLVKIDNYTLLRSILVKGAHELSKHVKNETLVNILEDPNIDDNFPLYSFLLKIQFRKGLLRSDTLQSANVALSSAIGLNLPDSCCDSILQYLTNEEIADLKIAVAVPAITSCKRKLSNDSTKMELRSKLPKKSEV